MPGVSFDRAVEYYDETRGFLPGVDEIVRDAIIKFTQATPTTRFLELGIGTGRIAVPFIKAGYDYSGVDISPAMMEKLRQKVEAIDADDRQHPLRYTLLEGDVTQRLPFTDNEFDVIIIVHVLHLVDQWQAVLNEARRLLKKPNGYLLIARDGVANGEVKDGDERPVTGRATGSDPSSLVHDQWDEILRGMGIDPQKLRPGLWLSDDTIEVFLKEQGAQMARVDLVEYDRPPLSFNMVADRHKARMFSADWALTDEAHAEATQKLDQWLAQLPNPDETIASRGSFHALAVQWPA